MTPDTPSLAVYHEHPDWFRPLFAELDRRGVSYRRIDAREPAIYDPADPVRPASVFFNRMSPSAYLRGSGSAILHTLNYLSHLERLGARSINGSKAFTYEVSKALQLTLLADLGLAAPRSRVIHRGADAPAAARGLRFPGGGQGQRRRQRRGHRALRYDRRTRSRRRGRPDRTRPRRRGARPGIHPRP